MGYLKCKECGEVYKLQEGESPDDFNMCHCGGEIEYHLCSDQLQEKKQTYPTKEELAKKKSSDRTMLLVILIVGGLIFLIIPIGIAALLIYRAYFGTVGLTLGQIAISAVHFLVI